MKLTFFSALFATAISAVDIPSTPSTELAEVDEAYNELEYYNDFELAQEAANGAGAEAKAAKAKAKADDAKQKKD